MIRENNISMCTNCDTCKIQYKCDNCEELLCSDCSEIHLKIKASRNHLLKNVSNSYQPNIIVENNEGYCNKILKFWNYAIETINKYLEYIVLSVHMLKGRGLSNLLFTLTTSICIHIISRLLFGKLSSTIYVIIGICVYKYYISLQKKYRQGIEKIAEVKFIFLII
jgi:hypothetical protein